MTRKSFVGLCIVCLIGIVSIMDWAVADVQRGGKIASFQLAATTVDGADVVLGGTDAQIVLSGGLGGECNIEVSSAAASQTLNGFELQFRDTSWGSWYTVLDDADFTVATSLLPRSLTPYVHGLAAEETTHFVFRPGAADAFRFRASVAANSAAITVSGSCGSE